MTNPIPKWIQQRYAILWHKFSDREFNHDDAVKILKEKKELISVLLSDLKKAGWLDVQLNPKDSRMRLYRLKEPNRVLQEMN